MKDLFGVELQVGDIVAFNPPKYKGLVKGKIVKFTPKMVTVAYRGSMGEETTNVFSFDVVKKENVLGVA